MEALRIAVCEDSAIEQKRLIFLINGCGIPAVVSAFDSGEALLADFGRGKYDLIFMDAAKGQYIHFMPDILRLLKTGGTLVSDNVLQDGDIIQSRYAVARRNRTIHTRMREYLYELKNNEALVTSIIPLGDGIALSVKKDK